MPAFASLFLSIFCLSVDPILSLSLPVSLAPNLSVRLSESISICFYVCSYIHLISLPVFLTICIRIILYSYFLQTGKNSGVYLSISLLCILCIFVCQNTLPYYFHFFQTISISLCLLCTTLSTCVICLSICLSDYLYICLSV